MPEPRSADARMDDSLPRRRPEASLTAHAAGSLERRPVAVGPGRPVARSNQIVGSTLDATEFPIQEAKVRRPPLRDATLRRDRLLDWLALKIHHRVVFVTAEAGYGKTTLLADFSRRSRLRTLWYRLDEEDRNWVSLLNYLVAAGRQVEPAFAPGTAAMLRELGTGGPARTAIVDTFVHELGVFAAGGAVLILDDYHLVDDVPDVKVVMREIVTRAPERLTIVFLSRRWPSIPLARLRSLGEIVELGASELRFDEQETEQLFRETFGTPLEPDVLADLAYRTQGWAASLQLVHAAIRDRSTSEIRAFVRNLSGAQGELHDYLAEEVVGDLDQDLQSFLMRTSILQVVDPEIAAVAAGTSEAEAQRLVTAAEQVGLLPPAGGPRRDGQRYHHLVRDFLEARLQREIGSGGVLDLHRHVARHQESRNWRLATHHYGAAGDVAALHRVISGAARQILGSGEFALAESYLERFPPAVADPAFDMVRSRMDLHRDRVPSALDRARAAFAAFEPGAPDARADLALANLVSVEFHAGNLGAALMLADQLRNRRPERSLEAIASATIQALMASTDGDLVDYVNSLAAMVGLYQTRGDAHFLGITQLNLSEAHRSLGQASLALDWATSAIATLEGSSSSHELATARTARAWALAHLGRFEESILELDLALTAPHALGRHEILQAAGDIHSWYGDPETGKTLLDEARLAQSGPTDAWIVGAAQNLIQLRRFDEAENLLASATLGSLSAEVAHKSRHLAVRAMLAIARKDGDAAERIAVAEAHAHTQQARLWVAVTQLLRGVAGDPDELNTAVRAAYLRDPAIVSIVAELVAWRLPQIEASLLAKTYDEAVKRPARWRPVLRSILELDSAPARIEAGRLLDVIGTASDVGPLRSLARSLKGHPADSELGRRLARRLAPRVFVEDQGRVTIRLGDRVIAGTEVRRKVLSLLCYLLTRPDLSATRDQVLDALWPEMEPDMAANSLNQTVYFLRRVFEPEYREDVSAGYVHHDSDVLWLDPELITSRSRLCRDLIRTCASTGSPEDVQALSEAYVGRFALDFAYEEWASPYRDSLHAAYLEVVERAIHADASSGHYDRGIAIARRAVDVDPEAEQLELALLRLYHVTGAHAAAAEQYGHYATVLRDELGIEPPTLETL